MRFIAAHHISVAVAQYSRQFWMLNACGDHEGAAICHRVVIDLDAEAHGLDMRGDEVIEVAIQLGLAVRCLAFGGQGDATFEQIEKGAVVELLCGVADGQ
ncbi:hypothetical protein D3C84_773190 [compost metagenome]